MKLFVPSIFSLDDINSTVTLGFVVVFVFVYFLYHAIFFKKTKKIKIKTEMECFLGLHFS